MRHFRFEFSHHGAAFVLLHFRQARRFTRRARAFDMREKLKSMPAAGAFAALLGAALVVVPACCRGADPPPERVSFTQALAIAMRQSRVIKAAEYSREEAADGADAARGAMLPKIDALENFSWTDNPTQVFSNQLNQQEFSAGNFALDQLNYPGAMSNFDTVFRFSQSIFSGGRLFAQFEKADFGASAAAWRMLRTRQQVAFAVVRAYYGAVLAEQRIGVVERALASARAHLAQAENLFAHGMAVKADVLRTRVMVGTLEQEQISARNDMMVSQAVLAHVLGDEDQELAPEVSPPELAAAGGAPMPAMNAMVSAAQSRRAEARITQTLVEAAKRGVTIAQAGYLPEIDLAAQYQNDSQHLTRAGNSYAVFVTGRLNIFNGMSTYAKIDAARAALARAKTRRQEMLHEIALEVQTAWRGLETARESVAVARRDNDYAAAALKILDDRYGAGLATNVEVLEAQASRKDADMRLVAARVAVMVSRAALDLAAATPNLPGTSP
jgi:outer membrane protein TolC